ncbi:MAG: ribose 5-phosphate isomerase B [Dehalococcoidia bacterium]|nr:ribose 5-phosphate isomerase B [Dehalococcoidia bacterium]MDD5494856.1 ribose 5-phosphate isomerase B [Dehalococcoidia bacterium]
MRVALGSDHRGFKLKNQLIDYLKQAGHEITDFGCYSEESSDYPDFAAHVCRSITKKQCDMGILVCGSGVGMSIAANKFKGIRAALCCNTEMASRARRHNNANVLCLGTDFLDDKTAIEITGNFISTQFEGGRHQRRIDKIGETESF